MRTNDIANIPLLECLVNALGQPIPLEPDLDLAGTILQFDEARLAHDALGHHAARYGYLDMFFFQRFLVMGSESLMQLRRGRIAAKIVRKRITLLSESIEFRATFRDQLVLVLFLLVCHASRVPVSGWLR